MLPETIVHAGIAVTAGGVLLNILKDELPPSRQARYWAFLLGIAAYARLRMLSAVVST